MFKILNADIDPETLKEVEKNERTLENAKSFSGESTNELFESRRGIIEGDDDDEIYKGVAADAGSNDPTAFRERYANKKNWSNSMTEAAANVSKYSTAEETQAKFGWTNKDEEKMKELENQIETDPPKTTDTNIEQKNKEALAKKLKKLQIKKKENIISTEFDEEIKKTDVSERRKLLGLVYSRDMSSGKNLDEILGKKMVMQDLMIELWNKIAKKLIGNTFDNFIFFATIIWPQTDPRLLYKGCGNYNADILVNPQQDRDILYQMQYVEMSKDEYDEKIKNLTADQKKEFDDAKEKKEKDFLAAQPALWPKNFEKNLNSCLNNGFEQYKERFINSMAEIHLKNPQPSAIISKKGQLYKVFIQYSKNLDSYDPKNEVTADNFKDFFYNDIFFFLESFKPQNFELAIKVARKGKLFVDEVFQQNYVEKYIGNLFKVEKYVEKLLKNVNQETEEGKKEAIDIKAREKLLKIEESEFPTIPEIYDMMSFPMDMRGGTKLTAEMRQLEEDLSKELQGQLGEELQGQLGVTGIYKNKYKTSLNNIKIQLSALFNMFRKKIISPKMDEIFAKRVLIIKETSSNESNKKYNKIKEDIVKENKAIEDRNKIKKEETTKIENAKTALLSSLETFDQAIKRDQPNLNKLANEVKETFKESIKTLPSENVFNDTFIEEFDKFLKSVETVDIINPAIKNDFKGYSFQEDQNAIGQIKTQIETKQETLLHQRRLLENAIRLDAENKKKIQDLKEKKQQNDNSLIEQERKIKNIDERLTANKKDTEDDMRILRQDAVEKANLRSDLLRLNDNVNKENKSYDTQIQQFEAKIPMRQREIDQLTQNPIEEAMGRLENDLIEAEKKAKENIRDYKERTIKNREKEIENIKTFITDLRSNIERGFESTAILETTKDLPKEDEPVELTQEEIDKAPDIKTGIATYVDSLTSDAKKREELTDAIMKVNKIKIFVFLFPEEFKKNAEYLGKYDKARQDYLNSIKDTRLDSEEFTIANEYNQGLKKSIKTEKELDEEKAKAQQDLIDTQAKKTAEAEAKDAAELAADKAKDAEETKRDKLRDFKERLKNIQEDSKEVEKARQMELKDIRSEVASITGINPAAGKPGGLPSATSLAAGKPGGPPSMPMPAPGKLGGPPSMPMPAPGKLGGPPSMSMPAPGKLGGPPSMSKPVNLGGKRRTKRSFRHSIKKNQRSRLHTTVKQFNYFKKNKNTRKNYIAYKPTAKKRGGKRTTHYKMESNKKMKRNTRRFK